MYGSTAESSGTQATQSSFCACRLSVPELQEPSHSFQQGYEQDCFAGSGMPFISTYFWLTTPIDFPLQKKNAQNKGQWWTAKRGHSDIFIVINMRSKVYLGHAESGCELYN